MGLVSLLCLGGESVLIRKDTISIRYFLSGYYGQHMLSLYFGIYHTFIVKELLVEERSKRVYL